MVARASDTSSKCKVELDSHAHKCAVSDNCLVIHAIIDQLMSIGMNQKMYTEVP